MKENKLKLADRCINYSKISEEPLLHSHIQDGLDEEHPLAYDSVYCDICEIMLHASNNECMNTWFETIDGNFCTKCFNVNHPQLTLFPRIYDLEEDLSYLTDKPSYISRKKKILQAKLGRAKEYIDNHIKSIEKELENLK